MSGTKSAIQVYLEVGKKRTFAGALDWPGWCASGANEQDALQALLDEAPRFAAVMQQGGLAFEVPPGDATWQIVERLPGNETTDFGAPNVILAADARPVGETELIRLQAILKACWAAFDAAVEQARGKELRKGPRGGGRNLKKMVEHVRDSEASYLSRLGGKKPKLEGLEAAEASARWQEAVLETLEASARGEIPEQGPRGGLRWKPRTFCRRTAWHLLDHIRELELRSQPG